METDAAAEAKDAAPAGGSAQAQASSNGNAAEPAAPGKAPAVDSKVLISFLSASLTHNNFPDPH